LVVAVFSPLTARAGEQASTTSENDSPVVVTPATAPDGSGIGASVSVQF
jgi:hypothetical protein